MSDLISRQAVLTLFEERFLELQIAKRLPENKVQEYEQGGVNWCINTVRDVPSADIMECARAIKEYCNQFSKCEDCGCLNKNYCAFYTCPDEWNLPEGEKE